MGNWFRSLFSKKNQVQVEMKDLINDDQQDANRDSNFEEDAKDAAKFATSMKQGDEMTTYEITLSCESLPKMDTLSLTDPMVVIFVEEG
jgi:hypothetical protein